MSFGAIFAYAILYTTIGLVIAVIAAPCDGEEALKVGVFWPLVIIKWSLITLFEILFTNWK